MRIKSIKSGRGFTIVELMIALSVLSTILVMATVIMINIGSLYSKGVNLANLQNTNRNILSDISSALQFGTQPDSCNRPSPIPPEPDTCYHANVGTTYAYCLGNIRYSYVLNRELGNDSAKSADADTKHVLWRDVMPANAACQPLKILDEENPTTVDLTKSISGYEMVGSHMRLVKFKVFKASTDVYNVDIWMAYGDSDLLCDTATLDNCSSDTEILPTKPLGNVLCKGRSGQQFCGTSKLSTTVTRRAK